MVIDNNKYNKYNYPQLVAICMQKISLREGLRKVGESVNKATLAFKKMTC